MMMEMAKENKEELEENINEMLSFVKELSEEEKNEIAKVIMDNMNEEPKPELNALNEITIDALVKANMENIEKEPETK